MEEKDMVLVLCRKLNQNLTKQQVFAQGNQLLVTQVGVDAAIGFQFLTCTTSRGIFYQK